MSNITFDSDFKNLGKIRDFVAEAAQKVGFSDKEIFSIQLAADEACSNIIEHAYADVENGKIEITCRFSNGDFKITFRDHGKSFNPSSVPEPNVDAELFERKIGGLGMYLMRKLMDEISYETSSVTGNTLVIIKRKGDPG